VDATTAAWRPLDEEAEQELRDQVAFYREMRRHADQDRALLELLSAARTPR
jgi:hypothetical protein